MRYRLLILSLFFAASVHATDNPVDPETPKQKKTLFLHAGPPKTGTTSIQHAAWQHRKYLKSQGVYYPRSFKGSGQQNHWELAEKVAKAKLEEAYSRVLEIEKEAGDCPTILLSAEQFHNTRYPWPYQNFLDFLSQHFNLRILYCFRDPKSRIGSEVVHVAHYDHSLMSRNYATIDLFVKQKLQTEQDLMMLYASYGCTFLDFKELVDTGNLVFAFFQKGLGLDLALPNNVLNTNDAHFSTCKGLKREDFKVLSKFFKTKRRPLRKAYEEASENSKVFNKMLQDLTVAAVNREMGRIRNTLTEHFNPVTYVSVNPDLKSWFVDSLGYTGKALDLVARCHYLCHGRGEGRHFLALPEHFSAMEYLKEKKDLELITKGMTDPEKIVFAQLHCAANKDR